MDMQGNFIDLFAAPVATRVVAPRVVQGMGLLVEHTKLTSWPAVCAFVLMITLTGWFIFKIVNLLLRTVPEAVQALRGAPTTLPEAAPAFVIYPAVQGDDIDDVLKNAPVATRRNSPLGSWL